MVGKVPRVGFVLVDFGTPEEERLSACWKMEDRPDRFFVPYTYVDACEANGTLLKQIFIHEGQPIKFHIHPSIANVNARAELSDDIQVCNSNFPATADSHHVAALWRRSHSWFRPRISGHSRRSHY